MRGDMGRLDPRSGFWQRSQRQPNTGLLVSRLVVRAGSSCVIPFLYQQANNITITVNDGGRDGKNPERARGG